MIGIERMHRAAAALAVALLTLGLAASAAAQEKRDDTPAVVKDFEAGQVKPGAKTRAGQKTKAGQKTADGQKTKARKKTVKLTFTVAPRVKARVYYGSKLLGTTPFTVDWPRNSGPVDVVVRAHGFLPVNTRAYTFRDDDVSVKLTRQAEASSLLGYRKPVEPPPEEDEEGEEEDDGDGTAAPAPTTPAPAVPATP